jgi:transcriptional regulator with XRE-family HTH domain
MSNLYERIYALCEEKGIKGAKMCSDTGISKGLLTDLKMGRRTGVSAVTAQKIATYFGVSVGYLLGEEEQKNKPTNNGELSEGKKKLYEFIESVPEDKVDKVLQVMKLIVEDGQ